MVGRDCASVREVAPHGTVVVSVEHSDAQLDAGRARPVHVRAVRVRPVPVGAVPSGARLHHQRVVIALLPVERHERCTYGAGRLSDLNTQSHYAIGTQYMPIHMYMYRM